VTCGNTLERDAWDLLRGSLSSTMSDADVATFGFVRYPIGTLVVTRISRDGPAAYIADVQCACGHTNRVGFGFGEFQPCRYLGFLVAVR
jgi:hypothetical protein